jgi:hypothetical protein
MSSTMTTTSESSPAPKRGRPSSYSTELAFEISQRLAEGESLRAICADDDMPDKATVMRWLHAHADFRETYRIAREVGTDALADEALHDATASGMRAEDVQAERLRFDARRWFLGKISPKRWGEKLTAEHVGADGGAIQLQALPSMLVPQQVAQAVRELIGQAEADMGLAAGTGTDQERLQRLLMSGEPLPPDVYEIVCSGKE